MQKFLCMPGNVLSERNAVVKTLTLTTGRNGKKKPRWFSKYQTPRELKEANLSILRTGQVKKRKETYWMKSKYGLRPPPRAFPEAGDKAQVHLTIASTKEYISYLRQLKLLFK